MPKALKPPPKFPKTPIRRNPATPPKAATPVAKRLIRDREVTVMTGVARSTLYRWMAEGRFPARIKVGDHASRWDEAEILEWIASRPRAV